MGRGMRWGTWIHSEGPKGRHDRLGIPSQDPRNNLENKTKGHCTNLMITQSKDNEHTMAKSQNSLQLKFKSQSKMNIWDLDIEA